MTHKCVYLQMVADTMRITRSMPNTSNIPVVCSGRVAHPFIFFKLPRIWVPYPCRSSIATRVGNHKGQPHFLPGAGHPSSRTWVLGIPIAEESLPLTLHTRNRSHKSASSQILSSFGTGNNSLNNLV